MTDYFGIIVAGIIAVWGLYLIWNKKSDDEAQEKELIMEKPSRIYDALIKDKHEQASALTEVVELKEGDDVLKKIEEVK